MDEEITDTPSRRCKSVQVHTSVLPKLAEIADKIQLVQVRIKNNQKQLNKSSLQMRFWSSAWSKPRSTR